MPGLVAFAEQYHKPAVKRVKITTTNIIIY